MKCPRCRTDDVYLSESGNQGVLSLFTIAARCHRCCHLFQVPRWTTLPKRPKPGTGKVGPAQPQPQERRAA
ncbi:MAG: hypothetical protein SFV23_18735 [Planctomycetaceae bacterium]|nr:hypothetical protein [Planctomycetaceae bacterium]